MRRMWMGLRLLAAALVATAGCASNQPDIRPPKTPDALRTPPEDDPRFSQPPEYPAGTLNRDVLLKGSVNPDGLATPGGSPTMRPGGLPRPGMQ